MYLKIHESQKGKIIAVCDKELIGQIFEDINGYMDLDRYRSFYIGELKSEIEIKNALNSFDSVNLVGKKSVKIALDLKLIEKSQIKFISKIPYIQIFNL